MKLKEEIKAVQSTPRELKKFGLTLGVFFALLGCFFLWRRSETAPVLLVLGAFFLVFGIAAPKYLWFFQKAWMTLALLMGWVMARVILTTLFYLIITPIGILTRYLGKDFMSSRLEKGRETYWIPRNDSKSSGDGYENQY